MTTPADVPMLEQCVARESGGVRCEVLLTYRDEPHAHWISDVTIARHLGVNRVYYTRIGLDSLGIAVDNGSEPCL